MSAATGEELPKAEHIVVRYVAKAMYGNRFGVEAGYPAYYAGLVSKPDLVVRATREEAIAACRAYVARTYPTIIAPAQSQEREEEA